MNEVAIVVAEAPLVVPTARLKKVFGQVRSVTSARIWARCNRKDLNLFEAIGECTGLVLELQAVGALGFEGWAVLVSRVRAHGLSIEQAANLRMEVEATLRERVAPLLGGFSAIDVHLLMSAMPDAAALVVEFAGVAWLYELAGNGTLAIMQTSKRRGRSVDNPALKASAKVASFRRRDPQEVLDEAKAVVKSQRERIQWARRRIVKDRNPATASKKVRGEAVRGPAEAFAAFEALDLAERSRPYQERNGELFKA